MYAIFPGIIGLVLSIISIVQANKAGAAKGMAIAGLVCALVGTSIAVWQYYVITKVATEVSPELENLKESLENLDTAKLRQEMESAIQQVTDSLQQH